MASNEVTSEGERRIKRWENAINDERRARSDLTSAECERENAATDLGKWLVPSDAKEGEKFCVWYGDSLIQAEVVGNPVNNNFKLTIRARGKSTLSIAA